MSVPKNEAILSTSVATNSQQRAALTKAFFAICRHWQLSNNQIAGLLGWSYASKRHVIDAMKRGERAIDQDQDKVRRLVDLLNIHKALRLLFASDRKQAYQWVQRRRSRFGDHSALEVMLSEGAFGIAAIRHYLETQRTR